MGNGNISIRNCTEGLPVILTELGTFSVNSLPQSGEN